MDEGMRQLEAYFETLKTRGDKLPSQYRPDVPHFRAISAASGVDFKYLIKEPLKQRVLLAAKEIGLTPKEGSQSARAETRFIQNRAKLDNYFQWLEGNAFRIPENPTHRGRVFILQLAAEAGLHLQALILKKHDGERAYNAQLIRSVEQAVLKLGLEVRVLPQSPGHQQIPFTYEQLFERGTEERKRELTNSPSAAAQLSNTRYAMNLFLEVLGLEKTAPVSQEFTIGFEASVDRVLCKVENARSRKKFRTEIYRWQSIYKRLLKLASIPDDIREAIVLLVDRSSLPHSAVAKLIGVRNVVLWHWYNGITTPSLMSIKPLARMESLFKLPSGTLVNKIRYWRIRNRFRHSDLPPFLRENLGLFHRISKHLPDDFCDLKLEAQEKIVESIKTDILRGDDDYTLRLRELIKRPYRLKEWPEPLRSEFDTFADFKMADKPPRGMRRSGTWKPSTKEKREDEIAFFCGALCLSPNADDIMLRGLGLSQSQLTLALIACPGIVKWYIEFRCTVRTQYTESAIDLLKTFISMLKPGTGWLRQSPHLSAGLSPITSVETHLVTEDLVSRAPTDWDGVCDDAIKEYDDLIEEIRPLVKVARDPFHRIDGILKTKDPMKALCHMIQEMKKALPNGHTQPVLYHTAVRDLALVMLIVFTGLRRGTIVKLDYTGDRTGHLYLEDGRYVLSIPRELFKNPESSFFGPKGKKSDYQNRLQNKYGFYDVLKEYLEESRPFLLKRYYGNSNDKALFISTIKGQPRTSARLEEYRISGIYADNVEKHLVENKYLGTGIANVKRSGPHSARHIRGTKTFRKTRSFKRAGDANQNSEETAERHYSRFSNEEVNMEVTEILFDD